MNTRGFTLIELLVVIAIIGLLSSIALASLEGARTKAYDARRISDLDQIFKALVLYHDDNDAWPCTAGGSTHIDDQSHCLAAALNPYLSTLPMDPLYGGNGSIQYSQDYQYDANATVYYLRTILADSPFAPTHLYPGTGGTCATDVNAGLSRCPWTGTNCVYRSSSCTVTWLHKGDTR